eukprot:m.140315 g.140315  ORF g.140315 m.140315 type:complete len:316 (-) comp14946_c0_seq11:1817-2764(-)
MAAAGYGSDLEEDVGGEAKRARKEASKGDSISTKTTPRSSAAVHRPEKSTFAEERDKAARSEYMHTTLRGMNAYDRHKRFINDYLLFYGGARAKLRPTEVAKNDYDVIEEEHRFLWDDKEQPATWEQRLAKKYYDKLFKEYTLVDLSRYREGLVALRWRTEEEVLAAKGQFVCGNLACSARDDLTSWEVDFNYVEQGKARSALVKVRLCPDCSRRLNHANPHRRARSAREAAEADAHEADEKKKKRKHKHKHDKSDDDSDQEKDRKHKRKHRHDRDDASDDDDERERKHKHKHKHKSRHEDKGSRAEDLLDDLLV